MVNTIKNFDEELQHKRILAITQLLEKGKAGLNREGRIVDLRKHPRASRISLSTQQAAKLLMRVSDMHIAR